MVKKVFAFIAAAMLICLSGCSEYVMTEEELALQKSLVGYWAADVDTGYNEFSEDGALTGMMVVEFTDDFHYLVHSCLLDQGYALTYPPIDYSFEDMKFKVMVDGVASFARLTVSDDGQIMYWHTDDKTDTYRRLDKDMAASLGVPEYSAESWVTDENGDYVGDSSAADTQPSDTEADEATSGGETEIS
ncbi:MAG: hypothetical protein NC395_08800 [Prevotella sp.]|nr:hypothetical protein [Prevotella sp.]